VTICATGATRAQDAASVVAATAKVMGAENLKSLTMSGAGSSGTLGQNVNPTLPWPLVRVARYTRTLDLENLASSVETVRVQNGRETPQTQTIPAKSSWNRQAEMWVATPFAFLKGATTNPSTLRSEVVDGTPYQVVSFKVDGKYTVEGFISDKNVVERARTWADNDVLGDMLLEGLFRDYKDFGGVKVPTLIVVQQGGFPTLIAGVADAKVNTPVSIPATSPAPAPSPAPAAAAPSVKVELVAPGINYLTGGSHHSVLVEFADHLTLIEAPQNEERSLAVLQAVRKLYPRKPLTQVVNTHHHFDHAGGLRTFVDAGATIITHDANKAFFDAAFKAPRTLNPDRLQASKKAATITTVKDHLVLSDATRKLELHALTGNPHDEGMLVAFLPAEKLLIEVDMYTPPAADAPAPAANAPVNPNTLALLTGLEKLRLDFDTILPLHGSTKATRATLYAAAKKTLVPISELPDPNAPTIGPDGRPRGQALPPPDLNNNN
jgi:glyoxylase-like metal-dependent hydrolase (beta-lactamase superfamily II)